MICNNCKLFKQDLYYCDHICQIGKVQYERNRNWKVNSLSSLPQEVKRNGNTDVRRINSGINTTTKGELK